MRWKSSDAQKLIQLKLYLVPTALLLTTTEHLDTTGNNKNGITKDIM